MTIRWDFTEAPDAARPPRPAAAATANRWWSRHFVDAMEGLGLGPQLTRGRRRARSGTITWIEISSGLIRAAYQDNRPDPYRCDMRLERYDEVSIRLLADLMAGLPELIDSVASGLLTHQFADAAADAGLPLFPRSLAELRFGCTCPDWSEPCLHAATLVYAVADRLDAEPTAILQARGIDPMRLLQLAVGPREPQLAGAPGRANPRSGQAPAPTDPLPGQIDPDTTPSDDPNLAPSGDPDTTPAGDPTIPLDSPTSTPGPPFDRPPAQPPGSPNPTPSGALNTTHTSPTSPPGPPSDPGLDLGLSRAAQTDLATQMADFFSAGPVELPDIAVFTGSALDELDHTLIGTAGRSITYWLAPFYDALGNVNPN